MTKKKILFLFLFLLLAAACLIFIPAYLRYLPLSYTPLNYHETNDTLNNPYQGFYHIYGYTLSEDTDAFPTVPETLEKESSYDTRLILLQINLKNYREGELSANALSQLDNLISVFSGLDKHLILRFLYDWNGNAMETEPQDLSVILSHIEQTANIYNRYASRIHLIQGLFTGNHGEMNNSRYQSAEDITALANALAASANPSIFLAVRTPMQWRTITGISNPSSLPDNTIHPFANRLGLYNDGMLGSDTDTGTYKEGERTLELSFQQQLCDFVPNGGEVIRDNPYNDVVPAICDMRTMHISYLNDEYDAAVLDKWKKAVYTGDDVFFGCSAYDYIKEHLGYRYVLRSSGLSFSTFEDEEAELVISIENTGFSKSCRPFVFAVTLINQETEERILLNIPSDVNSLLLNSGEQKNIALSVPVRELEQGTYEIYFSMSDSSSKEIIRFANDLRPSDCGYPIGALTLE